MLADVVWTIEQYGYGLAYYPVPSDAVYLASYALVIAGLLVMLRTQRVFRRFSGMLDATIIAVGSSIFVAAAVLLPLVEDSSLTLPGKLVSAAYPVFDVLLLVTAGQLWITPGARSRSYTLLLASLSGGLPAGHHLDCGLVRQRSDHPLDHHRCRMVARLRAACVRRV